MYTTKTTLINKLADGCEIGWEEFEKTYRPLILSVASKQGVPQAATSQAERLHKCNGASAE